MECRAQGIPESLSDEFLGVWCLLTQVINPTESSAHPSPRPARQLGEGTCPQSAQPYPECPQELFQVQRPTAVTVPSPAHTLCLSHVQCQPQLSQALLKLPRIQGSAPVLVQAAEKPRGKGRNWRVIPGTKWSGTGEGTAHLARPWMPEAPRDRHCSRSLSTVASTVSMLGSGSLGSWMR